MLHPRRASTVCKIGADFVPAPSRWSNRQRRARRIRASFFRQTGHFSSVFNHLGRNQASTLDRTTSMTTFAPAVAQTQQRGAADAAVFDGVEFGALGEMIGQDGVREMVEIFATETRQRLQRLTAGGQTCAALVREMHTLKGAAGTVAAPRLEAMGRTFERAAQRGVAPTSDDLKAINAALEAFLAAVQNWNAAAGLSDG
jgi:HPt (histidine-containing phosphotransfer) domain-containing protein